MPILDETYTLANGVEIPKLGLGTWLVDDADVAGTVRTAVELGYRHVDTAQAYGNERGVGEGIRTCGLPREELFVTTKVAAELKDHDAAARSIDESLQRAGLDHVDLLLVHSPQPWDDFRGGDHAEGNRAAWRALEEAYAAGKARAIGVSNFEVADLESLVAGARVVPHVNQVLLHVGNTPDDLFAHCEAQGILVEAYSPLGHGVVLDNEQVQAMAAKYQVGVPELCIRYAVQLGTVALPKATSAEHLRTNAQVDFMIATEDMEVLRKLHVRDYGEHSRFPVFGVQ